MRRSVRRGGISSSSPAADKAVSLRDAPDIWLLFDGGRATDTDSGKASPGAVPVWLLFDGGLGTDTDSGKASPGAVPCDRAEPRDPTSSCVGAWSGVPRRLPPIGSCGLALSRPAALLGASGGLAARLGASTAPSRSGGLLVAKFAEGAGDALPDRADPATDPPRADECREPPSVAAKACWSFMAPVLNDTGAFLPSPMLHNEGAEAQPQPAPARSPRTLKLSSRTGSQLPAP